MIYTDEVFPPYTDYWGNSAQQPIDIKHNVAESAKIKHKLAESTKKTL